LFGIVCVVIGIWTSVSRDWHPTRDLGPDDSERIRVASAFIESSAKSVGRMPSIQEFGAWTRSAPPKLRLDGVGFTYVPSGTAIGAPYEFQWYGGRGTWLSWSSDTSNAGLADISPSVYFVFGHKLVDLVVFFSLGALAFVFARWMVQADNAGDAR